MKVDQATMNRDRPQFSRILIEVEIDQVILDVIQFKNKYGKIMEQGVGYGEKPNLCTSCNGYGHRKDDCTTKLR